MYLLHSVRIDRRVDLPVIDIGFGSHVWLSRVEGVRECIPDRMGRVIEPIAYELNTSIRGCCRHVVAIDLVPSSRMQLGRIAHRMSWRHLSALGFWIISD